MNLVETAPATLMPTLWKRRDDIELSALWSYGRVWYVDLDDSATLTIYQDLGDYTDQFARAAFGTAGSDRKLAGKSSTSGANPSPALPFARRPTTSGRTSLTGSVADETTIGGGLSASRQFAANSSGDLQVTYRDAETEAALNHKHIFQTEGGGSSV